MKKKKLKIAIFHLAFVYSGGGERLVLEEAIRLKKLGHNVTCFVPVVDNKNCFPELIKQIKIKRLLPKILPKWYPDNALLSILAACLFTPLFFYKFTKFDIYFGANQPGPWLAYLLAVLNKKPYIIYLAQPTRLVHPRLIDQQVGLRLLFGFSILKYLTIIFQPLISFFDVLSIRNAKTVLANGAYIKGLLEQVYKVKAIDNPAGSNLHTRITGKDIKERFKGKIAFRGILVKKPYILITNRHFPHKKFEYVLDLINKLKEKKISLIITGQETEYTKLLRIKYRNERQIHFTGLLSETELKKAYMHSAVYTYPAPEEDFGMGIIEAMSYGVPVVAWGNAGPTGIINHRIDGFLARPFDTNDFASYIDKVLKNKVLYFKIANNAQMTIRKKFSYKRHLSIIENTLLREYLKHKETFLTNISRKKRKVNYSYFPELSLLKKTLYNNLRNFL